MRIPLSDLAALACDVVYRDDLESTPRDELAALLGGIGNGIEPLALVSQNHALALICRRGPVVIVAVRGTDPGQTGDVIDDCMAWQADEPRYGGMVHAGFAAHANRLWTRTEYGHGMANVWEALQSAERVIGVGHSLGGAVATLIAYRWARTFGRPAAAATFGAPAFGNPKAARKVSRHVKIVRCIHRNDVVSRLPGWIVWGALIPPAWILWGLWRSLRPWRYAQPEASVCYADRGGRWILAESAVDWAAVRLDQWLCRWDGLARLARIAAEVFQSDPWRLPGWTAAAIVRELFKAGGTSGIANHSARLYGDAARGLAYNV